MAYLSGSTFQNSGCAFVARVIDPYTGEYITNATISDVSYELWNVDIPSKIASLTSLIVSDCTYDTLQTGSIWQSRDNLGFNFRTSLPGTNFTIPGNYEFGVQFTNSDTNTWVLVWLINVQAIYFGS